MKNNNNHHHHHHKMDSASKFKRDSLNSIQRRKKIAKWGKRALIILACIMALLVIIAYTIG
jgi:hypothetical protein